MTTSLGSGAFGSGQSSADVAMVAGAAAAAGVITTLLTVAAIIVIRRKLGRKEGSVSATMRTST